ncbi:MAG: GNAT family N-acetyltransferase [Gammaproteobacteria bacterium]|nr:GNAT family N-acetyltransferase [Gammaproteobacteria bacterium]NND59189.1 GNAT family N-acetyltransferase [Gammaproteobacteria bacterium]
MITIRDATPADAALITDFNARLAEETEDRQLDSDRLAAGVTTMLSDPARYGRYFVAERGGDIVGQLAVTYEWSDWRDGWFWWFQSVYVRPAARRLGVFSALYDHVMQLVRERDDVCGLRLYVHDSNRQAQQTYLARGMHDSRYRVLEIEIASEVSA